MGFSLHQLLEAPAQSSISAAPGWLARTRPICRRLGAMAARAWRLDPEEALSAWFWSWLETSWRC